MFNKKFCCTNASRIVRSVGLSRRNAYTLAEVFHPAGQSKKDAYTLAEVVITMLIIATVVAISIKISATKLNSLVSLTYYSAYSTIKSVTNEMLGDYRPVDDYLLTKLFSSPAFAEGETCTAQDCADITQSWSMTQCACVPTPRTIPRKGENYCKLFAAYVNTATGSDECEGDTISSTTTDFSSKKADITLRNGLKLFNLRQNPAKITVLSNNIAGESYKDVPNINEYGYTIYADINGSQGKSLLWDDVYPFYVTMSGKVIPAYDKTINPDGAGGDNKLHLQISVQNEAANPAEWIVKSVSFKEGACKMGYIGPSTSYCSTTPAYSTVTKCADTESDCRMKVIMPVRFP